MLIFCCCYCRNSSQEEEEDGPPKKRSSHTVNFVNFIIHHHRIPDPREFLNQRIVRREQDGELRKGTVRRILNMEGINSMFIVDFDDGFDETFRLIYNFIAEDLWIEGQEEYIAEQNGYVA